LAGVLLQVEAFFRRCIAAGQHDGTISRCQAAEDLARTLLGILLGIRVLARTRPERELLEGLVRPVFAMLDNKAVSKEAGEEKRGRKMSSPSVTKRRNAP